MKILITFALENEFAPLRKLAQFKRVAVDAWDRTYKARIGSADVRVVLTGAGRFAAERGTAQVFDDVPDVCIVSGLAGGLKNQYALSEILVAREVAEAEDSRHVASDADLVNSALRSGAHGADRFLVAGKVVLTASEKQRLGSRGDAVDMESLYIMAAAYRHSVRSVAIRAISDTADSDLPLDFDRVFSESGDVSLGKVVGQLVAHPRQLPALLRLAHQSQRAAAVLATFLLKYIQSLETTPLRELAKADAIAI